MMSSFSQRILSRAVLCFIGGLFLWKAIILFETHVAQYLLPLNASYTPIKNYGEQRALVSPFLWVWANFDGYHYLSIADVGYHREYQYAFFPLYPFFIRLTQFILKERWILSGLLVSHVSFLFSLVVISRLLVLDGIEKNRWIFFLILLSFPTSFFYGAIYNDSLFFLFASLTLYFARTKHWNVAGASAILATLTRFNGLALATFLFLEYFQTHDSVSQSWNISHLFTSIREGIKKPKTWKNLLPILLVPLGLIVFLAYIQIVYGNFQKVFYSMSNWNQDKLTLPIQVFWRYIKIFATISPKSHDFAIAALEFSMVVWYIVVLFLTIRKIRFSYWIFTAISLLIPALTGTFQGMPRYTLHLYPFFLATTILLPTTSNRFKTFYFLLALGIGFFCITLFTRGYFVS